MVDIKFELIFLLVGYLISKWNGQHYKWDCICGEILGIGFLIIFSYYLYKDYRVVYFEPRYVGKLLILGYLPGRVWDWI